MYSKEPRRALLKNPFYADQAHPIHKDSAFIPYNKWYSLFINEKYYVYNIFTTNYRLLVIIGYNLNISLKLLFCPINNKKTNRRVKTIEEKKD